MKRLIIASALIAISASATVIVDEIVVSQSVYPDIMVSSFSVTKKSKTPNEILSSFKDIHEHIKYEKTKAIKCEGGQHYITPEYRYDNGIRTQLGYSGSVSYKCEFKKIEAFNDIISFKLKTDEAISLNPINWVVSDIQNDKIQQELENEIYQKTFQKQQNLSKIFNKACIIKEINFVSNIDFQSMPRMLTTSKTAMISSDAMESFEPTKDEQSITKRAYVAVECK
ncbi:MAG: SIMPL domain-containing protein [Arcobacteraceae bacterium]|nr:SIMPL domain-containing protein [Arcobacteraceae bacterium]